MLGLLCLCLAQWLHAQEQFNDASDQLHLGDGRVFVSNFSSNTATFNTGTGTNSAAALYPDNVLNGTHAVPVTKLYYFLGGQHGFSTGGWSTWHSSANIPRCFVHHFP